MCKHEKVTQIGRDRCFSGSVAGPHGDENPAAHGNITYTVECDNCGARQRRNVNQQHIEYGSWGPTRAQRRAEAERAEAEAARLRQSYPEAPPPAALSSESRGILVVVSCDPDGMLSFKEPAGAESQIAGQEVAIARALPGDWLDAATRVREHHLRAERATSHAADLRSEV